MSELDFYTWRAERDRRFRSMEREASLSRFLDQARFVLISSMLFFGLLAAGVKLASLRHEHAKDVEAAAIYRAPDPIAVEAEEEELEPEPRVVRDVVYVPIGGAYPMIYGSIGTNTAGMFVSGYGSAPASFAYFGAGQ